MAASAFDSFAQIINYPVASKSSETPFSLLLRRPFEFGRGKQGKEINGVYRSHATHETSNSIMKDKY